MGVTVRVMVSVMARDMVGLGALAVLWSKIATIVAMRPRRRPALGSGSGSGLGGSA